MRTAIRLGAFALAVAVCSGAAGSEAIYREYRARRVFKPGKGVHNPFGKSDVLAVDFLTTGFARPDGSDIRVLAAGSSRPVNSAVMTMGPGDRARVAVRMIRGVREYTVLYGGPKHPRPSRWEPQVGLLLETRGFNGGEVKTLGQMRALVKKSGPRQGIWFVPRIFQGSNLFGPSDRYVSIYRGLLDVQKGGTYQFATTSDDASYFLVDGEVVSSKRRWGRGPANARFAGKQVTLTPGAHKVEYLHVEGRDSQFCVGAWKPPGQKFRVIPPRAFPGVFRAEQTGLVITGSPLPIDLAHQASGELIYEEHHLYKVSFKDATPDKMSRAWSPRWDFGDGTTSDERHPQHVYFKPGEHTVTFALTRGRAEAKVRQKIVVGQDWEHQGTRREDTAARYYELAKGQDFRRMHTGPLDAAFEFFVTLGKNEEIMKTAQVLFRRDEEPAKGKVYRYAVHLGERLRDQAGKPDEALAVFREAVKRLADDVKKARIIRRIGDTLLFVRHEPKKALAEYEVVLDRYGKLKDNVVRLARIRQGDAYKELGEHDKALAAYKKAERMMTYERPYAVNSVRRGAFAQMIEAYARNKQFDEAQKWLDIWGWEHPADRIAGHWSLVAARVARARGDTGGAIREALACANANRTGRRADELLLVAGRLYADEGRGDEAAKIARRIQKEYPESGFQEDAALLECRGLLVARNHHEAAKKALAAYLQYRATEAAPAFLMHAANAFLASDDKPRAVEVLRQVVKDHPGSKEADRAKVKLKALGAD